MSDTFNIMDGSGEDYQVQKLYKESCQVEYYDPESKVYCVTLEFVVWH